jgi:urease accessory protein
LHRIAWHIGNRHTPCQIEADRLLIQRDHVIADMLRLIGAQVREVVEPFTPEGGAYGHGRTHGHDHSHAHGPVAHSHDHD